jgi:hypothetical protein
VEAILQKKIRGGVEHYLVSWKGYPQSQATWEPKANMTNCSSLILEYELAHLPQQEKDDLASEAEAPFKSSTDPQPVTIYEHNLNAIRPNFTILSCEQQLAFLRRKMEAEATLAPNTEVLEIIDCEREGGEKSPLLFGVKLRSGEVRKVRKEEVMKENKVKLV